MTSLYRFRSGRYSTLQSWHTCSYHQLKKSATRNSGCCRKAVASCKGIDSRCSRSISRRSRCGCKCSPLWIPRQRCHSHPSWSLKIMNKFEIWAALLTLAVNKFRRKSTAQAILYNNAWLYFQWRACRFCRNQNIPNQRKRRKSLLCFPALLEFWSDNWDSEDSSHRQSGRGSRHLNLLSRDCKLRLLRELWKSDCDQIHRAKQ